MKRKSIIFILLFYCTISSYTFEMSDLSVGDFTLIHEPTGKIFSFYDSPERFIEDLDYDPNSFNELNLFTNKSLEFKFYDIYDIFAPVTKYNQVLGRRIINEGSLINRLIIHDNFKTQRGIKKGSSVKDVLKAYNNCYYFSNGTKTDFLGDIEIEIFSENMKLYLKEEKTIPKNINSIFLICKEKNYSRLLDIKRKDSTYYVIKFQIDNNKVSSIGFYIVPYLP